MNVIHRIHRTRSELAAAAVPPALFVLLAALPAPAATLPHPGAHPTIGAAIEAASAGDTVLVAPGTYNEKFKMKNGVVLLSAAGPDSTIIVSPGGAGDLRYEYLIDCPAPIDSTTVIEGFTLDPATFSGVGVNCIGSSPTIRRNVIRKFGWGLKLQESQAIVEDNVIEETTAFGIMISACSPTVRRNEIRHNRAAGIEIAGKKSMPVIGGSRENANKIYGNVLGVRNGSRNDLNATFNDWGWETTEEMNREGYPSDIITIMDGNDFDKSHRGRGKVDYRHWIKPGDVAPQVAAAASNAAPASDGAGAAQTGPQATSAARVIPRWVPILAALAIVAAFVVASRRKGPNARS